VCSRSQQLPLLLFLLLLLLLLLLRFLLLLLWFLNAAQGGWSVLVDGRAARHTPRHIPLPKYGGHVFCLSCAEYGTAAGAADESAGGKEDPVEKALAVPAVMLLCLMLMSLSTDEC
jgi:hypothetical protein